MTSFVNRTIFNAVAGGTADFVVSSAVVGYQTPTTAEAIDGATYHYAAQSSDLSQWEDGSGVWNALSNTLTRVSVFDNSLHTGTDQGGPGNKINFTNPPQVYLTALAEDFSDISTELPGDALASAGTPPVAAHSMVRKLFASYSGNLFQVRRTSDNATLNIGTAVDGWADVSSLVAFLGTSPGAVTQIYDQTGNNNILPQATAGNQGALTLTYTQAGRQIPVVTTNNGQYYRNRSSTTGIPVGASPITVTMVVTNARWSYLGTYGDMESSAVDNGAGHMFALARNANGIGTDWENGVFYGQLPSGATNQPGQLADFVFALAKTDASTRWVMKGGPASSAFLHTIYDGGLPTGYTAHFEGGISLGEGGDGTPSAVEFVEGMIVAAVSADNADQAIQNNLAASFGPYDGFLQYPDKLFTNSPVVINSWRTQDAPLVIQTIYPGSATIALIDNSTGGHEFDLQATTYLSANPQFLIYDNTYNSGSGQTLASFAPALGVMFPRDNILGWGTSVNYPTWGTGQLDTGIGRQAPASILVGNGTFGDYSGKVNYLLFNGVPQDTTGFSISIGPGAVGGSVTTGQRNICMGFVDGVAINSGSDNVGVGNFALNNLTTGSGNVALGTQALQNAIDGGNNFALGTFTLVNLVHGSANIGIGFAVMTGADGSGNTAVGYNALKNFSSGNNNTAIGNSAGLNLTGASGGNTILGIWTGPSSAVNNVIAIADGNNNLLADYNFTTAGVWTFVGSELSLAGVGTINTAYLSAFAPSGQGQGLYAGVNGDAHSRLVAALDGSDNPVILFGPGSATQDLGISRVSPGVAAIGNGTAGDISGSVRAGAFNLWNSASQISFAPGGAAHQFYIYDNVAGAEIFDYGIVVAGSWVSIQPFYTNEAAFMLHSKTTITGGATGNVPTLTAGPVTGNPTKWLPYDDNGVTRYVPSW